MRLLIAFQFNLIIRQNKLTGKVRVVQIIVFNIVAHDNGNTVVLFLDRRSGLFRKNNKLVFAVLIAVKSAEI